MRPDASRNHYPAEAVFGKARGTRGSIVQACGFAALSGRIGRDAAALEVAGSGWTWGGARCHVALQVRRGMWSKTRAKMA